MQQRIRYASLALLTCFTMSVTGEGRVSAQSFATLRFNRLPATQTFVQLERLPSVVDLSPPNIPFLGQREAIQFAGGAVNVQAPQGWWTQEVPVGREVRLLLTPNRPTNLRTMPRDVIWIAYHPTDATKLRSETALAEELALRLRAVTGDQGQFSRVSRFRFGVWPAVVIEFTLPSAVAGRHILVRTDRGLLEFHAATPESLVDSRSAAWTATWNSLRLSPPQARNDVVTTGTSQIIATWKSFRSQMRFSANGRVVIVPDSIGTNRNSDPLIGTFDARGDLVFIQWNDGSRLNFRWRRRGDELLLTDHEGKITRLKRVFD